MPDSRKVRPGGFPARRPLYYYVTDRRRLRPQDFQARVRQLIRWGIDFIQIREKDLADRELFRLVSRVVESARRTPCRVLVNGRADVALAAGAHGVHLPSTGLRIDDMRFWLPDGFLIGVSVHSRSEAVRAWTSGADYLLLGPIFATPSKAGMGSPLGLSAFRNICSDVPVPVIGLGGIDAESVDAVLQAGASGVAAIRLFQESSTVCTGTKREFETH